MGLSHGHLPALRVPRRGSHLLFPPYPGLREPVGSLAPRYSLPPLAGLPPDFAKWQFSEVRASDRERNFESVRTTDNSRSRSCVSSEVSGSRGKTYRSPAGWRADRRPPHGIELRSSAGPSRTASGLAFTFSTIPGAARAHRLACPALLSVAPERGFRVRRAFPPARFKSVGRQTIAGAGAASAAKSPVVGEKTYRSPAGWRVDRRPPHVIEPWPSATPRVAFEFVGRCARGLVR